jgi:predicted nucleic acid-binding protein
VIELFVLDTSAILSLTENEPGADEVQDLISGAFAGTMTIYASFVTLTEVHYMALQEKGAAAANQVLIDLNELPIKWVHSDVSLCRDAAELKAAHRISFADSFVAATALRVDATLIHKDPEFLAIGPRLKQTMLPPK